MIFFTKRFKCGACLSLELAHLFIVGCISKLATDFCFKECEGTLLTPLGKLESRLGILRDCDGIVPTDCFVAITAAAFAILRVITPLAVVDP